MNANALELAISCESTMKLATERARVLADPFVAPLA
jgi:hypothetical protein